MTADSNLYGTNTGSTNPTPNGFVARMTIFQLIMLGYASPDPGTWGGFQLRNMPRWDQFYDINARVAVTDLEDWQRQGPKRELLRAAIRAALKERCKLEIHEEPSKAEAIDLLAGKHGAKLQAASPSSKDVGLSALVHMPLKSGGILQQEVVNGKQVKHFYWATMQDLADFLVPLARGRHVYDKTGLTGRYDFILREDTPLTSLPNDANYFRFCAGIRREAHFKPLFEGRRIRS